MEEKIYFYCAGFAFIAIGVYFVCSGVKMLKAETPFVLPLFELDIAELRKRVETLEAKAK